MGNKQVKGNQYSPERISHPGTTLNEKIKEMGMNLRMFSILSGISEACLVRIIEGEMGLNTDLANRIEKATHIPTRFWISRQKMYDDSIKNHHQYDSFTNRLTKKIQISEIFNFRLPKPISDIHPL